MTRRPAELSDPDRQPPSLMNPVALDPACARVLYENLPDLDQPNDPPMQLRGFARVRAASVAVRWTLLVLGTVLALAAVVGLAVAWE